jgi:predicted metal-binding protein
MNSTAKNDLQGCISIEETALAMGYKRAQLIWTEDVIFDPRTRIKCQQNSCTHYGQNFMCPPNLPSIEQYLQVNQRFHLALLVQNEQQLEDGLSPQQIDDQFKTMSVQNMKNLVHLEQSAFRLGFVFALSAAGGACKLCTPCKARLGESVCCQPQIARPSMEAIGIDISETCRRAGFPADFLPNRLLVTGLLYIV